jgi:hypothetical protein
MIQYINPFSRAWKRMKFILFESFNLGKWFALGFTAFLSGFMNSPGGSGGGTNYKYGNFELGDFFNLPYKVIDWLNGHPFWMIMIMIGIFIILALAITFLWLSSRGMFMFLDNVVHNRSLIEKPWNEFKLPGDSLFIWRLVFGLISFALFSGLIVAGFLTARNIYLTGHNLGSQALLIIGIILIGLILFLIVAFISLFLKDFIVPIMYKSNLTVNDAWKKFIELFSRDAWRFILYGLFKAFLIFLVFIGLIIFGFLTCCCGFILLVIPYINSVLLLPVSVTFRAFSLEFLEQFGDEYKIFPVPENIAGLSVSDNVTPAS